jgi:predicted DCC family thiol-disulfide oxidoreductase YuxK
MVEKPVILFDGVCNFCNGAVNFIIKRDKKKRFLFAALQSAAGQKLLEEYHLSKWDLNSFILIDKDKAYQKSVAVLQASKYLPSVWKATQIFRIVPRFFRDALYDVIAKNRYKWFGKREACMVPSKELRGRFLD